MIKAKITKKIVSVWALILLCLHGKAQLDTAFHNYYETAGLMVRNGSTMVFNSQVLTNSFTGKAFIYGLRHGQQIFKNTVIKHETSWINHMIPAGNGRVVYIGWAHGCDYIDTSQINFMTCIDTLGNVIFDNSYKDFNSVHNGQLDQFKQVLEYPDGSFFVITDTTLFHFNSGGTLLATKIMPTGSTALCLSARNTLILTRWNYFSGYKGLCEIDTSGNILRQDTCSVQFSKVVAGAGYYYALSQSGVIYRFDSLLHQAGTSQSTQGSRKITDLKFYSDTLFCSATISTNIFSLVRMDTSLTMTWVFDPGYYDIAPHRIGLSGSSAFVLSNESSSNQHNPAISLNEVYRSNNGMRVTKDVGVTQVTLDTAYSTYTSGGSATYYNNYYRIKVVVKNYGTDTVKRFGLNHKPNAFPYCGAIYYHQLYNATLAPGQSVTITTPIIAADGGACLCPPPTATYSVNVSNACFWTSVPDGVSDKDHYNDEICTSFTYTSAVGVPEQNGEQTRINIYPNPFEDAATVVLNSGSAGILQLHTVDGKLIKEDELIRGPETKIPLADLPRGIYFALIRFPDGATHTLKLVK